MFDPGERWEYGINIDWVGKAVEEVSGQSLEIYFREHIFEPLGMTDTGFLIGIEQKAPQRHACTSEGRRRAGVDAGPQMPQAPEFFMGGGGAVQHRPGLHGVPADAAARRHLQRGAGAKPETVAMMRQNQIGDLEVVHAQDGAAQDLSNDADFFPGMVHKWGLSFDINTEPGPTRAQRRQPVLGRAVQHLLLDRPDQEGDRHDHDPGLAVRRRQVLSSTRVRERPLRRPEGGLTSREPPGARGGDHRCCHAIPERGAAASGPHPGSRLAGPRASDRRSQVTGKNRRGVTQFTSSGSASVPQEMRRPLVGRLDGARIDDDEQPDRL